MPVPPCYLLGRPSTLGRRGRACAPPWAAPRSPDSMTSAAGTRERRVRSGRSGLRLATRCVVYGVRGVVHDDYYFRRPIVGILQEVTPLSALTRFSSRAPPPAPARPVEAGAPCNHGGGTDAMNIHFTSLRFNCQLCCGHRACRLKWPRAPRRRSAEHTKQKAPPQFSHR